MTFKDKLLFTLLTIITIGIYPIVVFNKKHNKKENELTTENKVSVDVKKLIELLGSEENISIIEYTHTKVKIFFKEREKVNVESIQKMKGISGIYATSKFVTIIVGPSAKKLAEKLM